MRNWIVFGVGGIAVVAGVAYYLYSHKLFPFQPSDQPIIISDSSVDVQLDDKLNLPVDKYHHRIKGRKVDHVTKVDSNGTSSPVCSARPCTVVRFQLDNDAAFHNLDISDNGSDTDLGVGGVAWDSNFWSTTGPANHPTLSLAGRLIDENDSWCQHCTYSICFSAKCK